jgi:hypothetical protein
MSMIDLYAHHSRPGGIVSTGLFIFFAIFFWQKAVHVFFFVGMCSTFTLGLVQLILVRETLQETSRYTPLNVLRNQEYGFLPRRWYDATYYGLILLSTPFAIKYSGPFWRNILSFWLGLSVGRALIDVVLQVYHPLVWLAGKLKRAVEIAAAKIGRNESLNEMIKEWELGDYSLEPLLIQKILGGMMACSLTNAQRKAFSDGLLGVEKDPGNAERTFPIWSDVEKMKASQAERSKDASHSVFLKGKELVQFAISAGYKELILNPDSPASYAVPSNEMVLFREARWRLPPLTKAIIPPRSEEVKRRIYERLSTVDFACPKVGGRILSTYFGSNIEIKVLLAFTSREGFLKSHLRKCEIEPSGAKRLCEFSYMANYSLVLFDPWTPDQITFDRRDIANLLLHIDPKFNLAVIAPNPFSY